jgi:heme/copper-type cytochrome/quinol oxidase subunit 3
VSSEAEIYPDYTREEFAVSARNIAAAAWLGAAGQAFFFVAFLFAFFYLRALNTNGRWNVHHIHPSRGYGVAILVCVLGSIAACGYGAWVTRSPNTLAWRLALGAAIVLALAAIGLQAAQYPNLSFGPGEGGFASVFFGWTGLFALNVLAVVYWLVSMLAETLNPAGRTLELIRPTAESLTLYWGVLGLIEILAFILLYLVA